MFKYYCGDLALAAALGAEQRSDDVEPIGAPARRHSRRLERAVLDLPSARAADRRRARRRAGAVRHQCRAALRAEDLRQHGLRGVEGADDAAARRMELPLDVARRVRRRSRRPQAAADARTRVHGRRPRHARRQRAVPPRHRVVELDIVRCVLRATLTLFSIRSSVCLFVCRYINDERPHHFRDNHSSIGHSPDAAALFVFIFGFAVGPGATFWVLVADVFDESVRGQGRSIDQRTCCFHKCRCSKYYIVR